MSKIAREHVKVSLSADGGDEVFGGYTKYTRQINFLKKIYYFRNVLKLPIRTINLFIKNTRYQNKLELVNDCVFAKDISTVARKRIESNYLNSELQGRLLNRDIPSNIKTAFDEVSLFNQNHNNILDIMMGVDFKTYMVDDVLHKVDRATMSVSLEGREPLLDHRLIEYVAQLPSKYKIKDGSKKHLLKSIVHQYIPKEMMDRPKKGFGIPFEKWFSGQKNELFNYYLSDEVIKKQGLFDVKEIRKLKEDFKHNSNSLTQRRLWLIFVMNQWVEEWI